MVDYIDRSFLVALGGRICAGPVHLQLVLIRDRALTGSDLNSNCSRALPPCCPDASPERGDYNEAATLFLKMHQLDFASEFLL